jgi:hypothetical protein
MVNMQVLSLYMYKKMYIYVLSLKILPVAHKQGEKKHHENKTLIRFFCNKL